MSREESIVVPAPFVGMVDGDLTVEADEFGDSYMMRLVAAGRVIAEAHGFRPGACRDFGADHAEHTAGTFRAFLSAAVEDPEFAAEWDVLADDASDWADALIMLEEEGA